jgi:hypothetical protein
MPHAPLTEAQECWLLCRRGLLMIIHALDKYFGVPHKPAR